MGLQTGHLSHSLYIYNIIYIFFIYHNIYIHDSVWQFEKGTCVTAQTCANPSVVRVTFFVRYRSKPWLDRIHLGLISYKVVCQFFSIVTKVYDRYIELVWGTWDGHVGWFQGMSFKWYVLDSPPNPLVDVFLVLNSMAMGYPMLPMFRQTHVCWATNTAR